MKKFLTSLLALLMAVSMVVSFAACKDNTQNPDGTNPNNPEGPTGPATYTYKDSVTVLSGNWNPHTYQTSDESYPVSFITTGLYGFFFNDNYIHVAEGKDAYEGYVIIPEMAAELPVDITEAVKAADTEGKYNIPDGATSGYAYSIKLNPNATWENGEAINADTYVYSMKMLLDSRLQNYRGPDYFDGDFAIANAKNYYYAGQPEYKDNGDNNAYTMADLVKGEDGQYYTADGNAMFIAVNVGLSWLNGNTLKQYVDAYGEGYFDVSRWADLVAAAGDDGKAPLTDDTLAMLVTTITGNAAWGETADDAMNYFLEETFWESGYSFDNVGIYKVGEYEIAIVLDKALAGFNLLYNLSGNWIVYQPYYDDCMKQIDGTDAWTTTYNTSLETTMSYGPYKMTGYQLDKEMTFEKNENWFGYTDGLHKYKDPEDGQVYDMYQTTKIYCQVVAEAETRKSMFLKGQLMGYGLQPSDFDEYRSSDYAYVTPSETIFFFIFNGHLEAIQGREAAEDFDKSANDLETLTLTSFRKAVAVTYDKDALCANISPSRSGGFGLIGTNYIYDPDTGAKYRDTPQAKKALCEFYSVDYLNDFGGDLDAAVESITGYNPTKAKELYAEAFEEALAKGYITDTNNDGICDQTIAIEYASSEHSDFIQQTLDYLNEKLAEVLVGTPFEGKINFYESEPLGNEWSNNIKNGLSDTVLGGWSGSALNPFSLSDLYTNPAKQYDAAWFDSTTVSFSLDVNIAKIGETANVQTVELTLKQWSDALNGATIEKDGVSYNFGDGMADVETRLEILAKIESTVLNTYSYIPMLQDGSIALLSQQVYYVVEEYNAIMGRGGIAYMKYNYNDAEWAAYVASQEGGVLKY